MNTERLQTIWKNKIKKKKTDRRLTEFEVDSEDHSFLVQHNKSWNVQLD